MSRLVILVTSVDLASPYDTIALMGNVWLEDAGPSGGYPWSAYPDAGATDEAIRAAIVTAAEAVAATHSWTYSGSTVVGYESLDGLASEAYVDGEVAARLAMPGASSSVSLSSGTARQPSTTRPVMVYLTGSWSWNLTAIGTATGSLSFKSDSSATPSTVVYAPAWSRGVGVGVIVADTGTMPVCMSYLVPAGHYYQVDAAGGATFVIREAVL